MTTLDYSWVLTIAYALALTAWLVWLRIRPDLWRRAGGTIERPWRELGWLLLSLAGVLGVGLLFERDLLLPEPPSLRPLTGSINQVLIFAPFLLLMAWRRQPLASAWIRTDRVPLRLGVGLSLAAVGTLAFTLLHQDADPWALVFLRVLDPRNLHWAVQVLLEDLVIAALFVRAAAALGVRPAMILTGALFAAGHIPAMLAGGESLAPAALGLVRDAGLVIGALLLLRRAADVWWMWVLHYSMDMMQKVSGAQLS